jgi:hypothetical protein
MVEHASRVVENLAHLHTMLDELGARRLNVVDDEIQTIGRAGCCRGDSGAEDDRTR